MVPVSETARTEHQFEISHQFLKTWFLLGCDGVKGSSDPTISFRNQCRKESDPHTTLKLNDEFLDRLKIDCHSKSESFYVESASFRH